MGNYRFKFSDMLPNVWFYKLKYMSKTTTNHHNSSMQKPTKKNRIQPQTKPSSISAAVEPPQSDHRRKSYHFTRDHPQKTPNSNSSASHFSDPPRKSFKKRSTTSKTRQSPKLAFTFSPTSAGCDSVWTKPDSTPEQYPNHRLDHTSSSEDCEDDSLFLDLGSELEQHKRVCSSNSCNCNIKTNSIIDMNNNPKFEKLGGFDSVSKFELPPIITKTNKVTTEQRRSSQITSDSFKEKQRNTSVKKLSATSPGMKLRTKSPRIANKRFLQVHGRKSMSEGGGGGGAGRRLSESFAVVKASKDPHRDFKESMVEMIMENNIRKSKDLEELLACYLSLNSHKYHDLIVKVFEQIWFEITDVRLKS